MKPLDFQHILKSLVDLSHGRREQRLEVLTLPAEGFAAGQIKTCFELAPKCPHCAHDQIHRHFRYVIVLTEIYLLFAFSRIK